MQLGSHVSSLGSLGSQLGAIFSLGAATPDPTQDPLLEDFFVVPADGRVLVVRAEGRFLTVPRRQG